MLRLQHRPGPPTHWSNPKMTLKVTSTDSSEWETHSELARIMHKITSLYLEELKAAYRRLCMLYHPDKHRDPELKTQAERLFNLVHQAYEVLSDPQTRAIYDIYGRRGLEMEGWEVVERKRTPAEIREEFERLQREREERRLQQRTNPKGTISVGIDATDLFDRYDEEYEDVPGSSFPQIEINKMHISQSIEAPLTATDTAILSGNLSTQNGNGGGSINLALRRVTSAKGWGEQYFGLGLGNNAAAGTVSVGHVTWVTSCVWRAQRFAPTTVMSDVDQLRSGSQTAAIAGCRSLIVVNAWYGKFVNDNSRKNEKVKVIDVTVPLQCLVKDSKLILTEASKAGLPGFYDPCVGEEKSLKVLYQFRGVLHQVMSADNEALRIPKQCK
ncbi:subfamily c member hypothetical protein [Limosa lapponica baueri]|uniref:J domain-containing protein n=1 Tax=Limosa lapponica baueri TaxID=1758121 RepID=A0A2I0TI88_LIMLA|nr:subfamily c member hypothetical protein [Limosa lapponica baueri]